MVHDEPGDGTEFNLHVGEKVILAQLESLRHPDFQIPPELWERFSGAELWGFLHHYEVYRVLITVTDPHYLVVFMADDEPAYIMISFAEYLRFQDYYAGPDTTEKKDWKTQGF
jgi:hypothetical protein